jgi:hypothetical protein
MGFKIDILCKDGSPLGVTWKTLWGEDNHPGCGGAEYCLLTMADEWTKIGHNVTIYNDPREFDVSPFCQCRITDFDPQEDRDILIVFRSPNEKVIGAKGRKVWWSHDQQSSGNYAEFSKQVDQVVCVSQFHADYFQKRYGIENATVIDNPTRVQDYMGDYERIPYRFVFTSVPERGLDIFISLWPEIKHNFPQASLVVTSDYRLWGSAYPLNERYRSQALGMKDIKFKGAIKRKDLIVEQLSADVMAYPCVYDELFCIAVSEACISGAYPITSTTGALGTTNLGFQIEGNPKSRVWQHTFLDDVFTFLSSPEKEIWRNQVMWEGRERFSEAIVLKAWDEKVFKHG